VPMAPTFRQIRDISIYLYIYIYTCMYVCMYVYMGLVSRVWGLGVRNWVWGFGGEWLGVGFGDENLAEHAGFRVWGTGLGVRR